MPDCRRTPEQLLADPMANYPAAAVACFDPTTGSLPRRQLDIPRTVEFLERLASAGAPAVLIGASTGQGHLRTVDELHAWFVAAGEARLGGCTRLALLRPEDGVEANSRLVANLESLDYPVVFVRPGTNLPPGATDAAVVENMQPVVSVAADAGLAVGVYSISDVSGVPLSADAVAQLTAGPGGDHIVAAKVTEADFDQSTSRYLAHPSLSHLKIVQGWDPFLARALQEGGARCGATSGPMSFSLFQYLHIFSAAASGDWQEVATAQAAVTALFESMQDDPRHFADLQRAKYMMGLGHPLTAEVQSDQVDRVLRALEGLPRPKDRARLARSLDLMRDGPYHEHLQSLYA